MTQDSKGSAEDLGNPSYDPDLLAVKVGDTIAVDNEDSTPHTVTNGKDATDPNMGKLFDTSIINAGDSSEVKLSPTLSQVNIHFSVRCTHI